MIRIREVALSAGLLLSGFSACGVAGAQQQQMAPVAATNGVQREAIEWLDIWVADTQVTNLPRVLLIGDSITRAYYPEVESDLKGKAVVARLATSKCAGDPVLLQEVALLLGQYHFDVIHFNNGMHGWGYSEQTYEDGIRQLIDLLRKDAPGARLIWATTTPVRDKSDLSRLDPRTERVQARNQLADALMVKDNIPVDDLYPLVFKHPEYWKPDGVHFNDSGTAVEAAQVAQEISKLLK